MVRVTDCPASKSNVNVNKTIQKFLGLHGKRSKSLLTGGLKCSTERDSGAQNEGALAQGERGGFVGAPSGRRGLENLRCSLKENARTGRVECLTTSIYVPISSEKSSCGLLHSMRALMYGAARFCFMSASAKAFKCESSFFYRNAY